MASSSSTQEEIPQSLLDFKVAKNKQKGVDLSKPVNAVWTCCKGYIRCSTDMQLSNMNTKKKSKTEKNHFSLEVQEDLINKEAAKLGLPLKRIYRDEAVSGSREDRNGLDEMVASLKRGDVLITVWLTRLTRGLSHFYDLVGNIHKKGIRIISIRDDIDTSKPGFEQAMHLKAIFGNMERSITRARISDTLAYKKERGEHVGRIPYGKMIGQDGKLKDVPEKRQVIEKILELRREGRAYINIVQILEHWALKNDIYKLPENGDWTIRIVRSICIREMGEVEARNSGKKRYSNDEQEEINEEESSESESEDEQEKITETDISIPETNIQMKQTVQTQQTAPVCIRNLKTEQEVDDLSKNACKRKLEELKELNYKPSVLDCVSPEEISQLSEKGLKSLLKDVIGL